MTTKLLRIVSILIACLLVFSCACAEGKNGGYVMRIDADGAIVIDGYNALYPIDPDAQPCPYRAEGLPVEFQIPAGWIETAMEKQEGFDLFAQFVPEKEQDQGMMIIVMAGNILNFVDDEHKKIVEQAGISAEDLNNDLLDDIDFIGSLGMNKENITKKTYAGQEWLQFNFNQDEPYGNMTIRMNMTSTFFLRKGICYQFLTIGNAESNEMFGSYEQMLETVSFTD